MLLQAKENEMIGAVASSMLIFMLMSASVKKRQRSSKIAELEVFLGEDPCQARRELSSPFGAPSKPLLSSGMHWKWFKRQGTSVPSGLQPRDVDCRLFAFDRSLRQQKRYGFYIASSKAMKTRSITAIPREKTHGNILVMLLGRRLGRRITLQRVCCVFCKTKAELFPTNCWNRTKTALAKKIQLNWCNWTEHCAKCATIQAKRRQSDSTVWQRSPSHFQNPLDST